MLSLIKKYNDFVLFRTMIRQAAMLVLLPVLLAIIIAATTLAAAKQRRDSRRFYATGIVCKYAQWLTGLHAILLCSSFGAMPGSPSESLLPRRASATMLHSYACLKI